jgi:hypothetical protein
VDPTPVIPAFFFIQRGAGEGRPEVEQHQIGGLLGSWAFGVSSCGQRLTFDIPAWLRERGLLARPIGTEYADAVYFRIREYVKCQELIPFSAPFSAPLSAASR